MNTLVIATPSDAPAIQDLLRETWKDTYGDHLSPLTLDEVYQKWQSIEFLTKQITNSNYYFPIMKDAEKVIGVATAHAPNETIQLFRLYIMPNSQRQGIGQMLLEDVIAHFRDAKKMHIYVEELNQKGQNFYRKNGFQEIGREPEQIVTQVVNQILMEKIL
jgi:diamine N-acetyltransferase